MNCHTKFGTKTMIRNEVIAIFNFNRVFLKIRQIETKIAQKNKNLKNRFMEWNALWHISLVACHNQNNKRK